MSTRKQRQTIVGMAILYGYADDGGCVRESIKNLPYGELADVGRSVESWVSKLSIAEASAVVQALMGDRREE